MNRPWMPLYIGDYLGDTGHLTTTQHGAYLLLMMQYWRKGGLPDDDKQLSKITKMPLKIWVEYRPVIQDFFHEVDGDPWRHKRIDREIQKMVALSEKRAIAGQKGGMWSAIAAQKRQNDRPLSKHASSQAIAGQLLSKGPANVHHSHSHITTTSFSVAAREGEQASPPAAAAAPQGLPGKEEKKPNQVSRQELDALYAARSNSTA
jgi:uncharacterized protein YdaU (DUF1376 family)